MRSWQAESWGNLRVVVRRLISAPPGDYSLETPARVLTNGSGFVE